MTFDVRGNVAWVVILLVALAGCEGAATGGAAAKMPALIAGSPAAGQEQFATDAAAADALVNAAKARDPAAMDDT